MPHQASPGNFLARVTGRPPPSPSAHQARNNLLMTISAMVGDPSTQTTLEELQAHPAFPAFARRVTAAGLDPVELIAARNRNIGDYESGGFASRVGDFMDRSGLGDLITYGTIATAGAGAAGAFGGGGAATGAGGGGATGTFGGNAALQTIGLPSSVGTMAVPGGAGVIVPGAGSAAVVPASAGVASMPSLSAGGGGVLSNGFFSRGMGSQIAGSLISGVLGTRAAGRAADAQSEANQAAIEEQRRQFDTILDLTAPGREVGNQSLNAIASLLGLPGIEGMEDFDAEALTNLPGTETIVNDAIRRIRHSGAARGSAGGNVLTELADRISGFQGDRMTNALFRLAGFGPQATNTASSAASATGSNVANLLRSSGIANASGILGAGRSQNAALQNILQYQALRGMLNAA